jgi:hypothetical protein
MINGSLGFGSDGRCCCFCPGTDGEVDVLVFERGDFDAEAVAVLGLPRTIAGDFSLDVVACSLDVGVLDIEEVGGGGVRLMDMVCGTGGLFLLLRGDLGVLAVTGVTDFRALIVVLLLTILVTSVFLTGGVR